MKKIFCDKCNLEYSSCNFKKHYNSCSGKPSWTKKRHDNIPLRGRTPRKIEDYNWTDIQNFYDDNHTFMETCSEFSISTHLLSKAKKIGLFKSRSKYLTALKRGNLSNKFFKSAEECRDRALKNNLGGYKENAGRSKKFKITDSFGNFVTLQSSYEYNLSEILNSNNIKWIRPKSLPYTIEGKTKKYFPDFYLPEYNIYLDPKNDFLIKEDSLKIKNVMEQNNVKVFILNKEDIQNFDINSFLKLS